MKYEEKAYEELAKWQMKLRKRSGFFARLSKKAQNKMNSYIPQKVQQTMTGAVKMMVKTVLTGSNLLSKNHFPPAYTLEEKEKLLAEQLEKYRKAASVEGAGTGAGGILLGLADFPLLLSIKIKFLADVAKIHGYDLKNYDERLFLLMVFQLAFSSNDKKYEVLKMVENWDEYKKKLEDIDWDSFQQEYRDYIDLAKMFQLLPGVGAAVGAYANYKLLDTLGETAKFAYRIRYFQNLRNIRE